MISFSIAWSFFKSCDIWSDRINCGFGKAACATMKVNVQPVIKSGIYEIAAEVVWSKYLMTVRIRSFSDISCQYCFCRAGDFSILRTDSVSVKVRPTNWMYFLMFYRTVFAIISWS